MVVDNFNLSSFGAIPLKTNSPLIIDADAILTGSVTLEFFEPVPWNRKQILKILCFIQV